MDVHKRLVRKKVAGEHPHLRDLPPAPMPEYLDYRAGVRHQGEQRIPASPAIIGDSN